MNMTDDIQKVKSQESSLPESSPCSTTFFTSTSDISDWGSQDVAIAAFLMLLWKDMYPARPPTGSENEWDTWGRPENGFIDLGCVSVTCDHLGGADDIGKRPAGPYTGL
jgi:hypothetical protein